VKAILCTLASTKTAAFLVSFYVLVNLFMMAANTIYRSFPEWRMPFEWYDKVPGYSEGFRDGCPSGMYAGGNIFVHSRYEFQRDVERFDDPIYKQGWNEGFSLCRSSVNAKMF